MDAVIECCAGLDVHQETVVACVLFGPLDRKPKKEIRTFSTTTKGLLALLDWLEEQQCFHIAMESTSVYWKPVWNILEPHLTVILANARMIKNVPGRKTDVKDAEWIAMLLRSGLIKSSFVPPVEIRDLRDLTRYRKKLIGDVTSEKNRIHKILQDANIKLTSCLTDLFGASGRNLIEALINGEAIDSSNIESLVKKGLKKKIPQILDALNGQLRLHHREIIRCSWEHIHYLEELIGKIESIIDQKLIPYREAFDLLKTVPGINDQAAMILISELGIDMSVFPSDRHLASWAGVTPGNNESAGKIKSSKTLSGNRAVKVVLCECAWVASKQRNSRIAAHFWRITKRQGKKKALIATAHLLIKIVYHILLDKKPYIEFGSEYSEQKQRDMEKYLIRKLELMGYQVLPQAHL